MTLLDIHDETKDDTETGEIFQVGNTVEKTAT
jgi:hypothetical protein